VAGSESSGALFVFRTITVKLCVALKLGIPSSATINVISLFVPPCTSTGVHDNIPVVGFTIAFVGPLTRLNVNVCVGRSTSLATLVKTSG